MISEFSGAHRVLSNFYSCSIEYDGLIYGSVEAAYQAQKTTNLVLRKDYTRYGPAQAKRAGRRVNLREDWENVKIGIMRELLRYKFREGGPFCADLQATKPHELVEGNYWGDIVWGQCPLGIGENWLGKLLMEIRDASPPSP